MIDKDHQLVGDLIQRGEFDIHVLGNESANCTIRPKAVYHISDADWHREMPSVDLLFCAVFGNNLDELAEDLAEGLKIRYALNPDREINLITCENLTNAAIFLQEKLCQHLDPAIHTWLHEKVGVSESIILSTCLGPGKNQDRLTIRAQNIFELPCNGEALKGKIPGVYGLRPMENFSNQLRRKIFTYNCINAVITYLGAQKDYTYLFEAGRDPGIIIIARQAAVESSDAQIAEYGFDRDEQYEWVEAAFAKFADSHIPDLISRNGADPVRKLSRNDRLIGPARLAIKYNIKPEGLMKGIFAGFEFHDEKRNMKISEQISEKGISAVLAEICELRPGEAIYDLLREAYSMRTASD